MDYTHTDNQPVRFDELNEKLGSNENPTEWRRHPKGGGWVKNTATVHPDAFVGHQCIVGSTAIVGRFAKILRRSHIHGRAIIADGVSIVNAEVCGCAEVAHYLHGGMWETTPLRIVGSLYDVYEQRHGYITIGFRFYSWYYCG